MSNGLIDLFLQIIRMSITSSVVILAVLLIRVLLRKTPKIYAYILWVVVLFRLICPVSFESDMSILSIFPNVENQSGLQSGEFSLSSLQDNAKTTEVKIPSTPLEDSTSIVSTNITSSGTTPTNSVDPIQITLTILAVIWVIGIWIMLLYSVVSCIRLKIHVRGATYYKDNIYLVTDWDTPFVMGLFNPRIYLPETLSEKEQLLVLHHEKTHISHLDHVTRLISFLALTLHWFNPLVWIAFHISGKDMEMACDEAVIKTFGNPIKKEYTTSLLALATGKRYLAGAPLAFGVGDTKGRIKNILNYKSPSFWLKVLIVALIGIVSIGLLANPATPDSNLDAANDFFNKQPGSDIETYKTVSAETLWNARTPYVGDNSAVSNILSLMKLPDNLSHDSIQLYTDENQRGLAWILIEGEATGYDEAELEQTALMLLAIIDNMEDFYVTVKGSSGEETEFHYDLAWANQVVEGNVKLYAESPEKLQELIQLGISKFPVVQYHLAKYESKGASKTVTEIPIENRDLAEAICMDYLIKSAAWEGNDVTVLTECYRIRQTYPQVGETYDYYAYLLEDGTPVLQSGLDGRYSTIAPSLYEQLVDSFN